jgi:TetR/AcrR family transcriptional regulator
VPLAGEDTLPERRPTRIQAENREKILKAALEVFARDGFRGATVDAIAASVGMSKPNLLYYFPTKEWIYRTVLEGLLDAWFDPLRELDAEGEPEQEISAYIMRKIELARDFPNESRLFASEMLRGAPILQDVLAGELKSLVDEKTAVIKGWSREGRIADIDPYHLIFAIWAVTQHYADFDVQVRTIVGDGEGRFHDAAKTLTDLFLRGLLPR